MTNSGLRRLAAWSEEDVLAKELAEVQLTQNFESVREASCSDSDDFHRIRTCMRGSERKIDALIKQLASSGRSLPGDASREWVLSPCPSKCLDDCYSNADAN